jgi:hypothetical protein
MRSIAVLVACVCVLGCRDSPHVSSALSATASPSPVPTTSPPPAALSTAAPSCDGADRRLYGSTCCEVNRIEDKVPGMVYLSCAGPQIGKACRAKGDCDVVCSCDPPDAYLGGGTPPRGPADGTRGAVGRCGGRLQIGTWMCQIDEHGTVTHVIVD